SVAERFGDFTPWRVGSPGFFDGPVAEEASGPRRASSMPATEEDGVLGAWILRHDALDVGVDGAAPRPEERLPRFPPAVEQPSPRRLLPDFPVRRLTPP